VHEVRALLGGIGLHALVADEADLNALKEVLAVGTAQLKHFA
jgi:hypothetical protein